jgi:hypothetical protein
VRRQRIGGSAAEAATNRPKVLSWLDALETRFQPVNNLLLRFVKGFIE